MNSMKACLDGFHLCFGYLVWGGLIFGWFWLAALAYLLLPSRRRWSRWNEAVEQVGTTISQEERGLSMEVSKLIGGDNLACRFSDDDRLRDFVDAVQKEARQRLQPVYTRMVSNQLVDAYRQPLRHIGFLRSIGPLLAVGGVAAGVGPFAESLGQASLNTTAFAASFEATVMGVGLAVAAHSVLFFFKGWVDDRGRILANSVADTFELQERALARAREMDLARQQQEAYAQSLDHTTLTLHETQ